MKRFLLVLLMTTVCYAQQQGNARPVGFAASRSDVIDVVADCGLPTDGVSDSLGAWNACTAIPLNQGKIFLFPKTQAQGAVDFFFSGSAIAPSGSTVRGTGYAYNSGALPPTGTTVKQPQLSHTSSSAQ